MSHLAPAGGSRKPLRERSGRDLILPRRRVQTLGRLRGARQGIVFKSERTPKCWGCVENSGDNFGEAKQVSDIAARFGRGPCRSAVTIPSAIRHVSTGRCKNRGKIQAPPSASRVGAWRGSASHSDLSHARRHGSRPMHVSPRTSASMVETEAQKRDAPVACPWMPAIVESGHP